MSNFASAIWVVISSFLLIAYILVMFHVVVDIFQDPELSGGAKALWIVGLLFVPIVTALIYLVVRGKGIAERKRAGTQRVATQAEAYVREPASTSSVDQIAKAKLLLDTGTINSDEFALIKHRAMAAAAI